MDAAAKAAQLAITRAQPGVYNVAEGDGSVDVEKATRVLGWDAGFRIA